MAGQGRAQKFLSASVPEEAGTALNGGRTYREAAGAGVGWLLSSLAADC